LGPKWTARFKHADDLALDLIATRSSEEADTYKKMQQVVWGIIDTAFSNVVITPGVTRSEDVVWWMRQKVNDLGLGTWFHPSVEVQRKGVADPVRTRSSKKATCSIAISVSRPCAQHRYATHGLRLLDGETDAPPGLKAALANSNKLQDIVLGEIKPGRSGNDILKASRAKMAAAGIDGTVYSHPIGLHGHGAGPLIGLWDYQDGVPGRGDAKVIPNMWFSIELRRRRESRNGAISRSDQRRRKMPSSAPTGSRDGLLLVKPSIISCGRPDASYRSAFLSSWRAGEIVERQRRHDAHADRKRRFIRLEQRRVIRRGRVPVLGGRRHAERYEQSRDFLRIA
jgi:Xaa-Pro aminopeptidase